MEKRERMTIIEKDDPSNKSAVLEITLAPITTSARDPAGVITRVNHQQEMTPPEYFAIAQSPSWPIVSRELDNEKEKEEV